MWTLLISPAAGPTASYLHILFCEVTLYIKHSALPTEAQRMLSILVILHVPSLDVARLEK